MQLCISLFFVKFLIYLNQHDYVKANPMFGVNVRDAQRGEFKFIVSISRIGPPNCEAEDNHKCTGTLISRQDVLTASHCFENDVPSTMVVLFGSISLRRSLKYNVLWWMSFNEWMEFMHMKLRSPINDIGNIRLRQKVPDNFDLAILSTAPVTEFYNKDIVIGGWGLTEMNIIPGIMRIGNLKTFDMEQCKHVLTRLSHKIVKLSSKYLCSYANPYIVMNKSSRPAKLIVKDDLFGTVRKPINYLIHITNSMFLKVFDKDIDANGDSGAPVLLNGTVVAIHMSTMPFQGDLFNPHKINIHTTVNQYLDFIMSVTYPHYQKV